MVQAPPRTVFNPQGTEHNDSIVSVAPQLPFYIEVRTDSLITGQLLRSLRDKANQWWYFLDYPEIPPDNNLAERESFGHASRTLRLAVTKRKVSGGSRSMERFQHTANLLTVVQTCRRQGRSVINFFVQALLADSLNYQSRPSLLPQY